MSVPRARPVQRELDDNEERGRGLRLVAALAAGWGTDERRWGKIVWLAWRGAGDRRRASGRSAARARPFQLVELFGTDGRLRISRTPAEPGLPAVGGEPEDDQRNWPPQGAAKPQLVKSTEPGLRRLTGVSHAVIRRKSEGAVRDRPDRWIPPRRHRVYAPQQTLATSATA